MKPTRSVLTPGATVGAMEAGVAMSARMFHQGAGIWRDGLRPGSGAADEANSGDYWRGKQARARCKAAAKNRAGQTCKLRRIAGGQSAEFTKNSIGARPVW